LSRSPALDVPSAAGHGCASMMSAGRGYRADIEEQPEVVFYRPECAQREFKD
jgi:hypothetical protein